MLIPKDEWERKIFTDFARVAGLAVDPQSVTSGVPPQPDIRFTVRGVERWFELVEITDQDPRWTVENRQFVDRAKPAISAGDRDR
jgi:hypothetical protein